MIIDEENRREIMSEVAASILPVSEADLLAIDSVRSIVGDQRRVGIRPPNDEEKCYLCKVLFDIGAIEYESIGFDENLRELKAPLCSLCRGDGPDWTGPEVDA